MHTQIQLSLPTGQQSPLKAFIWSPDKRQVPVVELKAMNVFGRGDDCTVRFDGPAVEEVHFKIERRGRDWIIKDFKSSSGTYVNDQLVIEAPLSLGDRIQAGEVQLYFGNPELMKSSLHSKNLDWASQINQLPQIARTGFPILIEGQTGTGKDVVAREIHKLSAKSEGPFVALNCGALNESLIESELFGHVKGAFTGALNDRMGAFQAAKDGTLFLDEIAELPIHLQAKLLRALENHEIKPVGSDRVVRCKVRIIAASHKDLQRLVVLGQFREDLYWRLNVCHISTPSLADRKEDIKDLIYEFCKAFRVSLSFEAIEALCVRPWPGNIRELRNIVARCKAFKDGARIELEDLKRLLPPLISETQHHLQNSLPSGFEKTAHQPSHFANGNIMQQLEREMILRRLSANQGNQRQTALDLGIPKSTLHDRLKTYSIDVQHFKTLPARSALHS